MSGINESLLQSNRETLESEEDTLSRTRKELIQRYESIVYDYLAIMNSSETMKSMESAKYIIQLGLNVITHIYKLSFYFTKNVATSADHCQKGIYCFIEYIEQTCKLGYINASTGNISNFDFMDSVAFIYDKTISDLKNENYGSVDEHSGSSSAFTNMLSVSQSHQVHGIDFLQCKTVLEHFGRISSVLIWFNHPTFHLLDQMDIINTHLIDFLEYSSHNIHSSSYNSLNKDIFLFLETIQDTIVGMDKKEYMELLTAIKKQIKKNIKREIDTMSVLPACLYLKTLNGLTLQEMIEMDKWKNGVNDLAKLAF